MELKKIPQADLENERTTFFLLGFIVVLATLFVLFEWSNEDTLSPDWEGFSTLYIEPEFRAEKKTAVSSSVVVSETGTTSPTVVYEDYNAVKETPVVEETISNLLEQVNQVHETDIPLPEITHELSEQIYTNPEVMPQYPGGYEELTRFIFNNIKYPASAISQKIQGTVWCSFIINKEGLISDIQVERGVHISLNQEAIQVLKLMPPWIPGTINGKPVRVKSYLPLVFQL
ncbi:MAG: energy transducer TonB [Dysgonamonadaceae bacterium]|jgi:protein TonB|nr:energy transducer TonB [Dysgonamonadaceae bacterium]